MARLRSPAARSLAYSLALGSVLLALSLKWLLAPYTAASSPFLPFLAAVMITAWFGGFAAAAAATAMSALLVELFVIPPTGSIVWRSSNAVSLLFFTGEALLIAYATAYIVRARADAVRQHQQSQRDLEEKRAALSRLMRELAAVTERERQCLAMELHDYQAQLLTVARMKLTRAGERLPPAKAAASGLIREADDLILRSLSYARTLMAELHPPILYEKGLLPALQWLAEQMPAHGLRVNAHLDDAAVSISSDHGTLVYQSVRELLMNIIKHSGVHEATLTGTVKDHILELSIADRGAGFDPTTIDHAADGLHLGLPSVRDRMTAIGGTFEIDSAPGHGTTMRLTLPVENEGDACADEARIAG
jgi:signal transduction histidine kinase